MVLMATKQHRAADLLLEILAGGPYPASEVEFLAAAKGISAATI